ncbi:hypothetical protein ACFVOR_19150 [Streptomyces sp. NPDC057837]|uniref:hypothetical protein n=1 Tax=Streptomyces sp. NPDC057837 TaxID=3346260 RepID=UPI0036D101F6
MGGADGKINDLLKKLTRATVSKRIEWVAVPGTWGEPTKFTTSLVDKTLTVWSKDDDGLPPFHFAIYGPDGQQIEEIQAGDPFSYIQELYETVRRTVLDVDSTIDDLIAELNRRADDPFA